MKIALQIGAPEPEQLKAFMQSYSESEMMADIGQTAGTDEVIAAYDSDRLIGLGSRVHTRDREPALQVFVAPGYESRGIGDHMAKLLLPKSERLVTAG